MATYRKAIRRFQCMVQRIGLSIGDQAPSAYRFGAVRNNKFKDTVQNGSPLSIVIGI